jgi:hypothetical protein
METAFEIVFHHIIVQALHAYAVPKIMIMAIQHYTLVGFAYVEVNGGAYFLITIKSGNSQGDPLSSIPFLIAMKPLDRLLVSLLPEIIYIKEEGVTVGPVLSSDDNLSPLSLRTADQLRPILFLCEEYTGVSILNINS